MVSPPKNGTWPYLNEIPPHFIHEIKTGNDVIGVNIFLLSLVRFLPKKFAPYTTTYFKYKLFSYLQLWVVFALGSKTFSIMDLPG